MDNQSPTSLLYEGDEQYEEYGGGVFEDLHIDQIMNAVTRELDEYRLDEIYRRKPIRVEDVLFRQAVARDLMGEAAGEAMWRFLRDLTRSKRCLRHGSEAEVMPAACKWHLDAAFAYCESVDGLLAFSEGLDGCSEGLRRFFAWLALYVRSVFYRGLRARANALMADFNAFRFGITIDMGANTLSLGEDEGTDDFLEAFLSSFPGYALDGARRETTAYPGVNMHALERHMLEIHALNRPGLFEGLERFRKDFPIFMELRLLAFDREALFYLSYLAHIRRFGGEGRAFALPAIGAAGAGMTIEDGYDLSLAQLEKPGGVVANGLAVSGSERALLLTGPNQGGKTTFARMLGQVAFFASAGLPAPCARARIPLLISIHTHFNAEEQAGSRSGRLQEELLRLRRILSGVRPNSLVILNELFSSATTADACEMGGRILDELARKGCLCLFVTHVYELARKPGIVSLVAEAEGDPPVCTYRILRREADGLANAVHRLMKYRLSRADIEVRKHAAVTAAYKSEG